MSINSSDKLKSDYPTVIQVDSDGTTLDFAQPQPADQILESRLDVPWDLKGHAMVTSLDSLIAWARTTSPRASSRGPRGRPDATASSCGG